jgi:peptidoglycan/LPS O-acetylase OafA/YrhL
MSSSKDRSSPEPRSDARWAKHEGLLEPDDVEALSLNRSGHADNKPTNVGMRSDVAGLMSWALSPILRFICYPPPGSLRLRRTAWLDGVRGVAALAVYIFHAMVCWAPIVPAWHADEKQTSVLQLPLVRTVFVAGGGAVSVFFVLSGYVLTHRCLRLIRAGSPRAVYPAVASSMFRRGFRLYLPPVLLTFCEMLLTRLGYAPPLNFSFTPEPTFLAQLWDWLVETNRLVNPLYNFGRAIRGFVTHPKYDPVIWTIPVEFYGSMVCYALLFTLARVSSNRLRMGFVALVSLLGMALGCWNIFCFAAGMLIADLNLGQDEADASTTALPTTSTTTPSSTTTTTTTQTTKHPFFWTTTFLIAFYLAGFPTLVFPEARTNPMPGFETLRALIPTSTSTTTGGAAAMEDPARFWWSVGGALLLLSASQLPRLRAAFETRACQYLARIAFALYLVHELCVVLFGLALQGLLLRLAGFGAGASQQEQGQEQERGGGGVTYWAVCVVWFGLFTVPVFALAAQVERWVDAPSVRFAKWLEERCLEMWKGLR